MPTTDGTQASDNSPPTSPIRDAEQPVTALAGAEASKIEPAFDRSSRQHEPERQAANATRWWRVWWHSFLTEFYGAEPQEQVAQIYHLTATLAVLGSLIAGIWAAASYLWPEQLTTLPHDVVGSDKTITSRTPPVPLSIVVLPFVNLSGDAGQDYFADGITDSLTTDLSRALPGSFVVARETAFTYKGKAIDARQIGRDLEVRCALEGSALIDGEQIRINARLIDAQAGNEIWADRFDTSRANILRAQDEIVGRLSRAVGLQVVNMAALRSERERARSADAIDFVLRGEAALNRPSSMATMTEARNLFEQALMLQSDNVDALAGIATTYVFEVLNGYYATDNELRLQRVEPLLAQALTIDDRHIIALKAKAGLLRAQARFDEAIEAAQVVIAQNPGEPWAYKEVGLSLMYLGRTTDALDWFEKAERLGPRDPGRWTWLGGKGQTLILLGRDTDAIAPLRAAVESNPADVSDYAVLAAAYALSSHEEEAREALAHYAKTSPGTTVTSFRNLSPVPLKLTNPKYLQQRERLKDGLRKAGMPE